MAVPLTLRVYKGDQHVATKGFQRDIIKIGRLASAHLSLDDEKVSRIHSVIEASSDGALSIIDMGSLEGTFVNGKRVNKGALQFGDEIKIGATTIRIETASANDVAVEEPFPSQPTQVDLPVPTPPAQPPAPFAEALQRAASAIESMTPAPPLAEAPPPPPPEAELPVAIPTELQPAVTLEHKRSVARAAPREKVEPAGPMGLSVRLRWGDHILSEHLLLPDQKEDLTVGTAAGVSFAMGDGILGGPSFVAARSDGQGFAVRFKEKMVGELNHKGQQADLRHLIESRRASNEGDAYSWTLTGEDFAWVDLGGVVMEARLKSIPPKVVVPFTETLDFAALNIFLLVFFLGALFAVSALNRNAEGDEYADELSGDSARIAKLIIKPPENKKNPLLEKLKNQKERQQGEIAAKQKGTEGQMGKADAPKRSAGAAPKGDPNNKDQARQMAQKIFGGKGISTLFGKNGLGGELKSAMGNMFGAAPGDAQGFGGLGLKGAGSGGGGIGNTIGIGEIGTKGRGGGVGSYGMGVGVLGGKKTVDIGITASDAEVQGSLDKELIRQVIRRNINQIRYCYESQLSRFPKLGGKVSVKFVITASGTVASSQVAASTAGNSELETCVAGRVRTWLFPKPKGGGVVIVTYPFVFKQSGD